MELPSQTIRRFSVLDSSSDDENPCTDRSGSHFNESSVEASALGRTPRARTARVLARKRGKGTAVTRKQSRKQSIAADVDTSFSSTAALESTTASVSPTVLPTAKATVKVLARSPLRTAKEQGKCTSPETPLSTADVSLSVGGTPRHDVAAAPSPLRPVEDSEERSCALQHASCSAPAPTLEAAVNGRPGSAATAATTEGSSNKRPESLRVKGDAPSRHTDKTTKMRRVISPPLQRPAEQPQSLSASPQLPQPLPLDLRRSPRDEGALKDAATSSSHMSPTDYCLTPRWQRRAKVAARVPLDPGKPTIYDRGMRYLSITTKKLEVMRQTLLEEESREATFRPRISARARSFSCHSVGNQPDRGEMAARLRQRFVVLGIPCCNDEPKDSRSGVTTHRCRHRPFSPRVSEQSTKIVRRRRAASAECVPVGERLYRVACQPTTHSITNEDGTSGCHLPARKRSQREIEEHIDSLYRSEARRQEALQLIRERHAGERLFDVEGVHVDLAQVVKRLFHPPHRDAPQGGRSRRKAVTEPDEFTFVPKINPVPPETLARARLRGLGAWFDYYASFSSRPLSGRAGEEHVDQRSTGEAAKVSVDSLRTYSGPHAEVARHIASVLEHRQLQDEEESVRTRTDHPWTRDAFIEAMVDFETSGRQRRRMPNGDRGDARIVRTPIWRQRPPPAVSRTMGSRSCARTDLTFHPKVNPRSDLLSREGKQARLGQVHERLFLRVKQKQLMDQQQKLEEMQRQLIEEEETHRKRMLAQVRWRSSRQLPILQEGRIGDHREEEGEEDVGVSQSAEDESRPPAEVLAKLTVTGGTRRRPSGKRAGERQGADAAVNVKDSSSVDGARNGVAPHEEAETRSQHQETACSTASFGSHHKRKVSDARAAGTLAAAGTETKSANNTRFSPRCTSASTPSLDTRAAHLSKALHELEALLEERSPSSAMSIDHQGDAPPSAPPVTAGQNGECARDRGAALDSTHAAVTAVPASPTLSPKPSTHTSASVSLSHEVHRTKQATPTPYALTLDSSELLLRCATCRGEAQVPSFSRAAAVRESRRRLAELGKELYKMQRTQ